MSTLAPQDHAEAIPLFRSEIVGALTRRELDRGDLAQALTELSQQRFRPPLAKPTKTYCCRASSWMGLRSDWLMATTRGVVSPGSVE